MQVLTNLTVAESYRQFLNSVQIEDIKLESSFDTAAYIIDELMNMVLIYNNKNKKMSYCNLSNHKKLTSDHIYTEVNIEEDLKNDFYHNTDLNKYICFIVKIYNDSYFHEVRRKSLALKRALHHAF